MYNIVTKEIWERVQNLFFFSTFPPYSYIFVGACVHSVCVYAYGERKRKEQREPLHMI